MVDLWGIIWMVVFAIMLVISIKGATAGDGQIIWEDKDLAESV